MKRAQSGSPKKANKKGELVSEISTVEIKKTTKVSTAPLIKKKTSYIKSHPPINQDKNQPNNNNSDNNSNINNREIPEAEEPLLKPDQLPNSPKKMEQKQPQIHPTPLQPQMSQMSHMNQPTPGFPPPFQNQMLLTNPSQPQLFNPQGQYSITVNTNDPNAFTTMMMPSVVSRNPVQMRCPYCNENICTVIKYENNSLVWILTILLFIFCCCCFCIPLLIDDIKDVIHYCPICNREIARIDR
ncbi:hypothetical protein BCR32DRAFT_296788 [Anaeromyces robustus]|uniref:LITAF domain-containing protein n=1 Tax=Anaeromyces robustus TaxID=1754192 RepID=A0A1Y1WQ70_9FUNG|nr:hypothetical protein BCR32DRAFT_296788 [Anaeromyces robustus]|eukprot:ORX75632.1 hypothetical protein BCR32DRAFT_296788 [Anaeromyces robustus]